MGILYDVKKMFVVTVPEDNTAAALGSEHFI